MKYLTLLFFLQLNISFCHSQTTTMDSFKIHENIYLLDSIYSNEDATNIVNHYNSGHFKTPLGNDIYHNFKNNINYWIYCDLREQINEKRYLTLWNHYYQAVEVFYLKNNSLKRIHQVNRFKNFGFLHTYFRLPTWTILPNKNNKIFIRFNNSRSLSSIKLLYQTENQFLKFVQKDTIATTVLVTFLIVLIILNLIFFQKESTTHYFWYGFFIFFNIVDFLAYKGYGPMIFWSESKFLITNFRTIAQCLSIVCLLLFINSFYGKYRINKIIKLCFKICIASNILCLGLFTFEYYTAYFENLKFTIIPFLRLQTLLLIIFHIVLAIKGKIPKYLGLAFSMPLFLVQINFFYNPRVNITINQALIFDNLQYIAVAIEIIAISYFIITEIIKEKHRATTLKKENLILKNNFQENLLKLKTDEKNRLLANVHDSFGGYLEALKLTFSNQNKSTTDKTKIILDAFYTEYRQLLNSLYTPEVNTENFNENLEEFCLKLDKLTPLKIELNFEIKDHVIPQDKCYHMYNIISELVTNAIKHANATNIKVNLIKIKSNILLSVSDNGKGLETNKNGYGYGLKNVTSRTELLNGNLSIISDKKTGTQIQIEIPI